MARPLGPPRGFLTSRGALRESAAGMAGDREAGDLWGLGNLPENLVVLDLWSGLTRTPPRTCGKDSRPPCESAHGQGCSMTWTAVATCAP